MARLNSYEIAVLLDWRHRAAARGEHANRVIAAEPTIRVRPWPVACIACHRDGRTLRAVGHRPGCIVGRQQASR